jgi:hypothetical protein
VPQLLDDSTWSASVGEKQIPYTELVRDGSPTFSIENDGTTMTRQILVKWTDLGDARNAFLGWPEVHSQNANSPWITRHTPDFMLNLLNSSNQPYLWATKLSGTGYGMPTDASQGIHDETKDTPIYRYAKLSVVYETLTYDVLSDSSMSNQGLVDSAGNPDESTLARYVTKEINPGAEYLTLPTGGFKFVGPTAGSPLAPVPVQGGPGKIVPNYDLALTWHLVPITCVGSILLNPGLANPSIDLCLGNVNNKPFPAKLPGGLPGWPVGSLLMTGCTIKPVRSTYGDRLYDIIYRFKFLKQGIQFLYYQGTQPNFTNAGYYEVTTTGATNIGTFNNVAANGPVNIYPWADFNQLFRVSS